jgi:hypothetical protein
VKLWENVSFSKERVCEFMMVAVTQFQFWVLIISSEAAIIAGDISVAAILTGMPSEDTRDRISLVTTAGPHALSWITDVFVIGGKRAVICLAKSRGTPRFSLSYVAAIPLFRSSMTKLWGFNSEKEVALLMPGTEELGLF